MLFVALDIDAQREDFSQAKANGNSVYLMRIMCQAVTDNLAVRYKKRHVKIGGLKLHPSYFSAALRPYEDRLERQPIKEDIDEINVLRAHIQMIRWLLYSDIPTILDIEGLSDIVKRTDEKTLVYAFDVAGADAVT